MKFGEPTLIQRRKSTDSARTSYGDIFTTSGSVGTAPGFSAAARVAQVAQPSRNERSVIGAAGICSQAVAARERKRAGPAELWVVASAGSPLCGGAPLLPVSPSALRRLVLFTFALAGAVSAAAKEEWLYGRSDHFEMFSSESERESKRLLAAFE